MSQNIFDDPGFFSRYVSRRLDPLGHNELIEKPAMLSLLPPLGGASVLDLGCGHGALCRFASSCGARAVVGVDISSRMLSLAQAEQQDDRVRYINADMVTLTEPDDYFDLVMSSLALHYIEQYNDLVANVKRMLASGGQFVFSVEHPLYTATTLGWERGPHGERLYWKLDEYSVEGKRAVRWLDAIVEKYHRKIETYLMTLIRSGFIVEAVLEPDPDQHVLSRNPNLAYERKRPPYLVVSARIKG